MADLLIRGKADADGAVGPAVRQQMLAHGQDLGDTGLVVGAQDHGAVGGDQGLTHHVLQVGKGLRIQMEVTVAQGNSTAVIVRHQTILGRTVLAGGDGVQMGDKADLRHVLHAGGGGDLSVDIGVIVHVHILQAHLPHLLLQCPGQIELAGGGRSGLALLVADGIKTDVADQSLISFHSALLDL